MRTTSSSVLRWLGAAVLAALPFAAAQYEEVATGTVAAVVGGSELTLHTYATSVPADVADGVEDERQRAILERVAGTEQHTATFMVTEEMTMGPVVLVPATIYVTVLATAHVGPDATPTSFEITFSLSPDTLELGPEEDVAVRYSPDSLSSSGYYALTEGALELGSVRVVDATTLAIAGSIRGVLSWQEGFEPVHDPDDALSIEATFDIQRVASSDDAYALVGGE